MHPAIEVDGVWKQYRYGTLGYGTLRRDLQSWWARRRGREDPNAPVGQKRPERPGGVAGTSRFWALEAVGFAVRPGEVVGVVGRNGAGKSTLLKILSRVTSPSRGEVRLRGRVASLLEVGTGFHPELTGRENVYLNGAILGMGRLETRRKFDEIVAFAALEPFIDTPVKRYSSGMYVRLAFAVAAHLEPEILLVDEVLAVGDLEFQRKCLGRLEAVAGQGRAVLFVSHNLGAVSTLCPRALLLSDGRLVRDGETADVLGAYLAESSRRAEALVGQPPAEGGVRLLEAEVEPDAGVADAIPVSAGFALRLLVDAPARLDGVELSLRIERQDGQRVLTTTASDSVPAFTIEAGRWEHRVRIPGMFLAPGTYFATVGLHRPNIQVVGLYEQVLRFVIAETGSGMWKYHGTDYGVVLLAAKWSSRRAGEGPDGRLGAQAEASRGGSPAGQAGVGGS